jgi:Xaa-Pro aminopeptidase
MAIPVGRPHDVAEKVARVRSLLDRLHLKGILLRRHANVAWLTGGRDTYVTVTGDTSVAAALVTADRLFLLTNRIESPRMADEENLAAAGFEFVVGNWYEDMPAAADVAGGAVGVDGPFPDGVDIASTVAPLRYQLTDDDVTRYRWVGHASADALQKVARAVTPGITEHHIAGQLHGALAADALVPTCILVATDERVFRYRHPLPTGKRLDRYAMLVVGARRWGLHVSCTRLVYFGALPADLRRKAEATARIDATYITTTCPGTRISDIFRTAQDAYAGAGYPDEWQLHHQGGACGYEGRDYVGTPASKEIVVNNQAFAWNPSIAGAKSEDTVIVNEQGFEVLSLADGWPMWTFVLNNQACSRPVVLEIA